MDCVARGAFRKQQGKFIPGEPTDEVPGPQCLRQPCGHLAQQGVAFDLKIWDQWEKTGAGKAVAMPGALEAMAALRAAGVLQEGETL